MSDLGQLLVSGLSMGSIYALLALGYHLIHVSARVINFALGEQMAIAGLFALTLMSAFRMPLALAVVLSVLIGAAVGLLYEVLALRPAYKQSHAAIICSIGLSTVLLQGKGLLWGKDPRPFPDFSGSANAVVNILGARVLVQSLWVIGLMLVAVILVDRFFALTMLGKAMRAAAMNQQAARLVGIDPALVKTSAVVLASALATLAGLTAAPFLLAGGFYGLPVGIKGFTAAIIGGYERSLAVVAGGLIVGVFEALLTGLISSSLRDMITFALLIVALAVKPEGIFGAREVSKV